MNTILTHLSIWFSIESEPLMLAALMCVFGAYVLTQLLKNIATRGILLPGVAFQLGRQHRNGNGLWADRPLE